jgi:hypothetical protein
MADKTLFTRLNRLFSSDIIIRNVGGNQIKVVDTNTIQSSGQYTTNSLMDRYKLIHSTAATSLFGQQSRINYQYLRTQLYSEYDVMDSDGIIAPALDIIADECSLKNDMNEVLQIRSSDDDVQKILYNLFYDILNVEYNLWSWVRQMCKYGDFFLKLEISTEYGIYNAIPYTAYHIERHEGYNPDNPSEIKYIYNPDGFYGGTSGMYNVPNQLNNINNDRDITFDNYEVAHFRLISDVNYLPYGRSYLEPIRKEYKKYSLMEEAMLLHRIVRAPEKRVFYINVGAIPPNEVDAFMQQTINNMKRVPFQDKETGEYNLKYNLQNQLEDFYIPVRGNDTSTKIDTTKGLEFDGVQDVEYFLSKIFAGLKIPKAFLGYEKDLEGKSTLAAQDIRFARTIERIQRILVSELNKIALIHLYTQGYRDERLVNFELRMQTPSIIFEQEKVELLKSKAELTEQLLSQKLIPSDWIYDNIYQFSEDQFDEYRDLVREDAKRNFRLAQIEEEGNDPVQTGKSYGTPHDLATLYGRGRMDSNPSSGGVPDGYDEDVPLGRPEEEATNIHKQEGTFGKDRLGVKGMKNKDKNDSDDINPKVRKPNLTLERAAITYLKNKPLLNGLDKRMMLYEEEDKGDNLLDESQLRE